MSRQHDFIPRPDGEFDAWFFNMMDYVQKKGSAWDHIPARFTTELLTAYTDWRQYYVPTLQPHLPAAVVAKNDARRRAA